MLFSLRRCQSTKAQEFCEERYFCGKHTKMCSLQPTCIYQQYLPRTNPSKATEIRSLHSATKLQSDSTKATRSHTRRQFSSMAYINSILEDGARRLLRNVRLHGVKT
jgi:hypothetical protein